MRDQLLSLTGAGFGLVTQSSDVGDGLRLIPAATSGQATEPIGRTPGPLTQNDRVVGDLDIQPIPGFDPKLAPHGARDRDLMLGTDLYA